MNRTDMIGAGIAIAIVFLLGWWLHRVNKSDDRLEALGMWALGCGAFVGVARMAGVA